MLQNPNFPLISGPPLGELSALPLKMSNTQLNLRRRRCALCVYFFELARAHYGYSISLPWCSGAAVGRLGLGLLVLVLVLELRLGLIISVEYVQCALLSISALASRPRIKCRAVRTDRRTDTQK